ncbi:MAG: T9SS type A sorting domain-containing protein, partial [Bacteroidales bacterium]|nr:T9SS type A sorting domain-containing protein [Bacteroidales bacterium]
APAHHEALTGYFIYRKTNADGTWERIKVLGADKTEYKETRSLEQGNWYYYKVIAYYREIDCNSIPAKSRYNNEYFVKIWYSPDGVDENTIQDVEIYPNPAKDMLTIKADRIDYVKIYNSIGQIVFENKVNSEEISINLDGFDVGVYLVKAVVDGEVITRKVSIQK